MSAAPRRPSDQPYEEIRLAVRVRAASPDQVDELTRLQVAAIRRFLLRLRQQREMSPARGSLPDSRPHQEEGPP